MSLLLGDIDVLILCGGLGRRLKKISGKLPKPMVKFGNKHFLVLLIKYLANFGFRRFILGIGYKAEIIQNYFANNNLGGIKISFSCEREPLGTGGAVKLAKDLIRSNPFFIVNGDSICEFSPLQFLNFHKKRKSIVSILLSRVPDVRDYGRVILGDSSKILSFKEKNTGVGCGFINSGVYLFDKKAFSLMPASARFSLEYDFFPDMVGGKIYGFKKSANFIDIGTVCRYRKAKTAIKKYSRLKFMRGENI